MLPKVIPKLAQAYRLGTPAAAASARIFIHVPNEEIYECLVPLRDGFKDL